MKPLNFITKNDRSFPLFPRKNQPTNFLGLPTHPEKHIISPKKEIIPTKYKELSKSYAIMLGTKGKEHSQKAAKFAAERGKKFIADQKIKEKLREELKREARELLKDYKLDNRIKIKALETIPPEDLATMTEEDVEQHVRKAERSENDRKKFDVPFKNIGIGEDKVIGGDAQRNVLIMESGKEIPAPTGYYGEDTKRQEKPTSEEKKELVDSLISAYPSGSFALQEVN